MLCDLFDLSHIVYRGTLGMKLWTADKELRLSLSRDEGKTREYLSTNVEEVDIRDHNESLNTLTLKKRLELSYTKTIVWLEKFHCISENRGLIKMGFHWMGVVRS